MNIVMNSQSMHKVKRKKSVLHSHQEYLCIMKEFGCDFPGWASLLNKETTPEI